MAGIETLFSAKSPDFAAAKQRIQKTFTDTEQLEIKALTIRKLNVRGTSALARVSVEITALDRKTKAAAAGFGKMDLTVRAAKQDGDWKVSQFIPSADDFAAALIAAKSEEERKSILDAEPEMVTIPMQRAVMRQGNRFLSQESFSEAIAVYYFAIDIAEKLGDKVGIAQ